jgi:hypothetical protein
MKYPRFRKEGRSFFLIQPHYDIAYPKAIVSGGIHSELWEINTRRKQVRADQATIRFICLDTMSSWVLYSHHNEHQVRSPTYMKHGPREIGEVLISHGSLIAET